MVAVRPTGAVAPVSGKELIRPPADKEDHKNGGVTSPLSISVEDSGSLSAGAEVDVLSLRQLGYLMQYFAVGLIYGGLPATTYGLFQGYLSVPGHVYATARIIMVMPWAFKFAFGLLNDTVPIAGYRRKPYMALGWAFCALMLLTLSWTSLPPPYWCHSNVTGEALTSEPPCNEHAETQGGRYALLMMAAALGYVVADVAADGLTVEFARREVAERRGRTQTTAYMVRTVGVITASLLVGLGMNGAEYNGSFRHGLSFNSICAILAAPAALMVPVSWFFIHEPRTPVVRTAREYLSMSWELLRSRAMLHVSPRPAHTHFGATRPATDCVSANLLRAFSRLLLEPNLAGAPLPILRLDDRADLDARRWADQAALGRSAEPPVQPLRYRGQPALRHWAAADEAL